MMVVSLEEAHPAEKNDCEKSNKTETVCDVGGQEEKMDVETNEDRQSPHESFVSPSLNGIKPSAIELEEKSVVTDTCNDDNNSDFSKPDDETLASSPTTLTNGVVNHEIDNKSEPVKEEKDGEGSVKDDDGGGIREDDDGGGETNEIPSIVVDETGSTTETENVDVSHSVVEESSNSKLQDDEVVETLEEKSVEKSMIDERMAQNDVEMKEISEESPMKTSSMLCISEPMETDKTNGIISSEEGSEKLPETKTVSHEVAVTNTTTSTLSSEESPMDPIKSGQITEPIRSVSPVVTDDDSSKRMVENASPKETVSEVVAVHADSTDVMKVEQKDPSSTEIQPSITTEDTANRSQEQNMTEERKKANAVEEKVNRENDCKNNEKKITTQVVDKESTKEVSCGVKRRADRADMTVDADADREGGGVCSSSSSVSGSEGENNQECKRIRFDESIFEEDERERLIREFVERSTETSDDIGKHCEKLQHEITALSDLARAKELEWNSIMRLLKLKEEMLERIQFRKRHLDADRKVDFETDDKIYKNFITSAFASFEQKNKTIRPDNSTTCSTTSTTNNQVNFAPVSSATTIAATSNVTIAHVSQSSDSTVKTINTTGTPTVDSVGKLRSHRPILPKPSSVTSMSPQHPPPSSTPSSSPASSSAYLSQLQVAHASQVNSHTSLGLPTNSLIIDQNSIIGEGRQGPTVDVKSIIADFRSKNPDSLPRRGRRNLPFNPRTPDAVSGPRFLPNTALLSMANMALGSGSHVRTSVSSTTHNDHRTNSFLLGQDGLAASLSRPDLHIRPANIDSLMLSVNPSSSAVLSNSSQQGTGSNSGGNVNNLSNNANFNYNNSGGSISNNGGSNANSNSFQEALVKFAKMNEKRDLCPSQSTSALHVAAVTNKNVSHLPPPPPYPEVTLHPVLVPQSSGNASPVQNSLLHGILTKSNSGNVRGEHQAATQNAMSNVGMNAVNSAGLQHRPTTFSPTLARLLTAPERNRTSRTSAQSSARNTKTTLNEILHNKKSRTEVTITPVTTNTSSKPGSDVVLVEDDDETDPTDRLVIDEGREVIADGTPNVIPADQVPECQGCHKKAAQFVCAGCGNQWYCSRECQVQAWEDHSEMCSG